MKTNLPLAVLCCVAAIATGCNNSASKSDTNEQANGTPSFSLAYSEYPSWSIFGVAEKEGLIDGEKGALGDIEMKWRVDIVLNFAEYDPCITQYGTSVADAVCITNMDILSPSLKRASVAILPTSTSVGADACITVGIDSIDALKGKTTYGLEKSVSQYCFERVLEKNGKDPSDFEFKNQDPGVAAMAMQSSQDSIESIMVWNPFVMQTLKKRKDSKVLFDSSQIEEEIIDMVVVAKDSLNKPGGKAFAYAIADAFFTVNAMINDTKTADETLSTLGEEFGKLSLDEMRQIVQQTRMYDTAEKALALLEGDNFKTATMPTVAAFCLSHEICESEPTMGFNEDSKQLNFDSSILEGLISGAAPADLLRPKLQQR